MGLPSFILFQLFGGRELLALFILTTVLVPLAHGAYNLWWHPLARFPGPKRAAVSPFWAMWYWLSGENLNKLCDLHNQYGSVVRIAPNQLSFCSSSSWKDVHGHKPGRKPFLKGPWYRPFPQDHYNIVSVSNPGHHALMRKSLSHGFSSGALIAQEDRLQYFINKFVDQIDTRFTHTPGDMTKWYNFVTFDAIGELAFGEAFGCVESGEPHFWIDILFAGIKNFNLLRSFEYFPLFKSGVLLLLKWGLLPSSVTEPRRKQTIYAREKLIKRLTRTSPSTDFLEKTIADMEKNGTSFDDLLSQATLLTIAGSETTATALAGITYFLCKDPSAYEKLRDEIRSAFFDYGEITGLATEKLPYLRAVILEGLRMYPPLAAGLPRISPGETIDGQYIPEGAIVSVNTWAAGHVDANFREPFKFNPERWLDPDCKDNLAASQPFLLGSRVCLGRHLAMLEMRLILSKLLWKFDMTLMDKELDWGKANKNYVFWDKPELPIQFHRREGL